MPAADLLLDNYQERIDKIVLNAMHGNLTAAARAGFFPNSLSPEEKKSLSEQVGLKSPAAELLDVVTNPFILAGLVLSIGFKSKLPNELVGYGGIKDLKQKFFLTEAMSPVIENFINTDVPPLLQHGQQRYTKFLSPIGKKLSEVFAGASRENLVRAYAEADGLNRPGNPLFARMADNLATDYANGVPSVTPGKIALAQKLYREGMALRPLDARERVLANGITEVLNEHKGTLLESGGDPELILNTLHHLQGLPASATSSGEIRELIQYAPHVSLGSQQSAETAARRVVTATGHIKMAELLGEEILPFTKRDSTAKLPLTQASTHAATRRNSMVPMERHLKGITADPSEVQLLAEFRDTHGPIGKDGSRGAMPEYTLDAEQALGSYFDSVARSHAWAARPSPGAKPIGYQLTEELARLMTVNTGNRVQNATNRAAGQYLLDTIIPTVLGARTPYQYTQGSIATGMRAWAAGKLQGKLAESIMPERMRSNLIDKLLGPGPTGITQGLSSYLFTSTLGWNISSAVGNLPQQANTIAYTGVGPWAKAVVDSVRDFGKAIRLKANGMSWESAMETSFPDIYGEGIELDPLFKQSIRASLQEAYEGASSFISKGQSILNRWLMDFFRASESTNRIVGFRAGVHHFNETMQGQLWRFADRLRPVETAADMATGAREYGVAIVNANHFGTGILNTPKGLVGVDSLFKQFAAYPVREAAFILGPLARNPNAMGRAMLTSGLIYEAGKHLLGVDTSRATVFGGIPSPQEGLPGAPLPVVPPLFQIAAAAVDPAQYAQKTLPLLVPGGVSLARMFPMGFGSQTAGKVLNRNYTDYNDPITDANGNDRFAVRKPDGSLVGHFTRTQLLLRAFGFNSTTMQQEQNLTAYITAQRDRMRQYKKSYLDALVAGDRGEAGRVQEDFTRAYPGFKFPITKNDIKALNMRQDISRLERVLQTVPAESREMFTGVISQALGADTEGLFALQESGLMAGNTVTKRDSYRLKPRPRVPSGLKESGLLNRGENTAKRLAGF